LSITEIDLDLDSSPVKVRVQRDLPNLSLGGENLGPLKEGDDVDLPRWMANELAKSNIVKVFEREPLDMAALAKIHWRECIPSSREIPPMQNDFYYKLRGLLKDLLQKSEHEQSIRADYDKALSQSKDIVNCRLHKILYIAAGPPQTDTTLQKLAAEERALYNQLCSIVNEWKRRVLSLEDEK